MPGLRGLSRGGAGTRGSPACPRSSSRSGWWWCGSGRRAAAASWPPPAPPARWRRRLQGVRGGVRGLGEPPNNFFPTHTLTDGDVHREQRLRCRQRPDVEAVHGLHASHCQQRLPHGVEVHAPGGAWGGATERGGCRAHGTHGWFSPPRRPRRVPTLHEDEKHVAEDGERCPQHQGGEEEGADGIHELVLGLGEAAKAEIPPPVPPPASKSPSESIPSISPAVCSQGWTSHRPRVPLPSVPLAPSTAPTLKKMM